MAVVAVIAALGLGIAAFTSMTHPAGSASGSALHSTAAPQSSTPVTTETVGYPEVRVAEGKHCGTFDDGPFGQVGTANKTTSCPFAINVHQAYVASGINGGDGTVEAYSPVTKEHYTLNCSGSQPALCTGGVAARVIIFGGQLIVEGD